MKLAASRSTAASPWAAPAPPTPSDRSASAPEAAGALDGGGGRGELAVVGGALQTPEGRGARGEVGPDLPGGGSPIPADSPAVKRREEPRIRAESRGISGESPTPAVRRRPGGQIGWGKRRGREEARREGRRRRAPEGRGGALTSTLTQKSG